jgi:competence protein ComEC
VNDIQERIARHPRHVGLVALIAGILLSGAGAWVAAVAGATMLIVRAASGRALVAIAAGTLLFGGAFVGSARREAIDRSRLGAYVGYAVGVRGYVVKRERPSAAGQRMRIELTSVEEASGARRRRVSEKVEVRIGRGVRIPPLAIGDEVTAEGALKRPANGRRSRFDYAGYLRRAGVHALLEADWLRPTGRRRGGLAGFVDLLRRRAEVGVSSGLEPPLDALARGVVLGQDEAIPGSMADEFKASGLAHILAVSGQNVTLLALLALPILAALGVGRRSRLVVVLALIALYVPLTGAGPSVLRAGAMGAAATVALLVGRPASRWYALLLAAAFTLLLDPRCWLDPGWQLSFAAVVSIFVVAPALRPLFARLPAALAEGAAITVSATLATAPLMAFHFERVSLVSLAANLAALPAVAPLMWLGMLSAACAQLWVAPATLLNALNGYCLAYLAGVARWSAGVPSAVAPLRLESAGALAGAYVALAALFLALRRSWRTPRRRRALAAAAIVLVFPAALLAGLAGGRTADPPRRFTVTFLDIGQGDATLLQAPAEGDRAAGGAVLVDGGPPGDGIGGMLRDAGVRSLDLVVLSHPQLDHEGGLVEVMRRFPVAAFLDGGWWSRDPVHARVAGLARAKGARVIRPAAGQRVAIGGLRVDVLNPEGGRPQAGEDPNDRSVVVHGAYGGLDVLLTGDAESNVTLGLGLRRMELLKVAHHGSADDGIDDLLERLDPQAAVIEVGEANPYGHPSAPTLRALQAHVPNVYRTDRDGAVRITLTEDGPTIEAGH